MPGRSVTLKPTGGEPANDHAFRVPARTGRKDADELASALETAARWMTELAPA